ncbi:MAG TPA: hypothetical protein EYO76_14415 [Flavobacteriaceae bacterium]|nr:hypothetical protein [Flavobacteriaceae bacterium]
MKHSLKLIILVLCITTLACSNDDNAIDETTKTELKDKFVGEWLRSDSNESIENRINLENNNMGYITHRTTTEEGVTSSLNPISWSITANQFTIIKDNTETTSTFEFLDNGHLLLPDISEFEFIKQ